MFQLDIPGVLEEDLIIATFAIAGVVLILSLLVTIFKKSKNAEISSRRTLIVTAHPDDECMFFGPYILRELAKGTEVYLLCLSPGDFSLSGYVRKEELFNSCEVLGIPASNLFIIQHGLLQDNRNRYWKDSLVSNIVLHYAKMIDVDTIVSFDAYGVSGHYNHISIYEGLVYLLRDYEELIKGINIYCLESVPIFRKYTFFVDIALANLFTSASSYVYTISFKQHFQLLRAMRQHVSQLLWFRRLYCHFSRYMFIASFRPLLPQEAQAKAEVEDDIDYLLEPERLLDEIDRLSAAGHNKDS